MKTRRLRGGDFFNFLRKNTKRILTSKNNASQKRNKVHEVNIQKEVNDAKEYFYSKIGYNNINYNIMKKKGNFVNQTANSMLQEYFTNYKPYLTNSQKQNIQNYVKKTISTENARSRTSTRSSFASDPGSVGTNFTGINNNNVIVPTIENLPTPTKLLQESRMPVISYAKKTFGPIRIIKKPGVVPQQITAPYHKPNKKSAKNLPIMMPKLNLQRSNNTI